MAFMTKRDTKGRTPLLSSTLSVHASGDSRTCSSLCCETIALTVHVAFLPLAR